MWAETRGESQQQWEWERPQNTMINWPIKLPLMFTQKAMPNEVKTFWDQVVTYIEKWKEFKSWGLQSLQLVFHCAGKLTKNTITHKKNPKTNSSSNSQRYWKVPRDCLWPSWKNVLSTGAGCCRRLSPVEFTAIVLGLEVVLGIHRRFGKSWSTRIPHSLNILCQLPVSKAVRPCFKTLSSFTKGIYLLKGASFSPFTHFPLFPELNQKRKGRQGLRANCVVFC